MITRRIERKPLSGLKEGENGTIVEIHGKASLHYDLLKSGLMVGRQISVIRAGVNPDHAAFTVAVDHHNIELNEGVLSNIRVS
jgi:Fe2+ transport system protein FeoA